MIARLSLRSLIYYAIIYTQTNRSKHWTEPFERGRLLSVRPVVCSHRFQSLHQSTKFIRPVLVRSKAGTFWARPDFLGQIRCSFGAPPPQSTNWVDCISISHAWMPHLQIRESFIKCESYIRPYNKDGGRIQKLVLPLKWGQDLGRIE
jgi:hypothetical protein